MRVKVFVEDKPEHAKVLETKTIREAVNVVLRTMGEKPKDWVEVPTHGGVVLKYGKTGGEPYAPIRAVEL